MGCVPSALVNSSLNRHFCHLSKTMPQVSAREDWGLFVSACIQALVSKNLVVSHFSSHRPHLSCGRQKPGKKMVPFYCGPKQLTEEPQMCEEDWVRGVQIAEKGECAHMGKFLC